MSTAEINWTKRKLWTADQIVAERTLINGEPTAWGRAIEHEVRRRIRLCVAAYAYEVMGSPIMADHEFDLLAQTVNAKLGTCHPALDEFFAEHFSPMTGMWIHQHPELGGVKKIYERHFA